METGSMTPPSSRKKVALKNVALRRSMSLSAPERPPVDLQQLVRVYMLDGSSKLLQMKDSSTAKDVLEQLKYNMDLSSIKTFALYRVSGAQQRRIDIVARIKDVLVPREGEETVRILFRSWISDRYCQFDKEAMQDDARVKSPNSALWLKFIEGVFMVLNGKCYLTEDESMMLGCLKMQADSGDYRANVHNLEKIKLRIATSFPSPLKDKMVSYMSPNSKHAAKADEVAMRAQLLYSRLAGYTKAEAQIEYLRMLRVWCPFYGGTFFYLDCQYDDDPTNSDNQPPVIKMTAAITQNGIYLISTMRPPVILRQPFNRIVKWSTHVDLNIFCYWVLKDKYQLSDIERAQSTNDNNGADGDAGGEADPGFDANMYCDCVYLVTDEVLEVEFLVKSYLSLLKNQVTPLLPGDTPDLEMDDDGTLIGSGGGKRTSDDDDNTSVASDKPKPPINRRASGINRFFQALSGGATENSSGHGGIMESDFDTPVYGDDTPTMSSSVFKDIYQSDQSKNACEEGDGDDIDMVLAASLEELNRLSTLPDSREDETDSPKSSPKEQPRRRSMFNWSS